MATSTENIHWKLAYDIALPRDGSVHVHNVEWDEDAQTLFVYVSTSKRHRKPENYKTGTPLYEENEAGFYDLVGMNPDSMNDPPQTLVRQIHVEMAERLLG
jgi:hypothetical protein